MQGVVLRPTGTEDSNGEGGGGERDALRPTGTEDSTSGERPGILAEPRPQRSDRTVRHSAGAGLPTLPLPSLAGSAAKAVDASTLDFLLGQNLAPQRKDVEEKKEKEVEAKAVAELAQLDAELVGLLRTSVDLRTPPQGARLRAVTRRRLALQEAKKRKRKKRRRRSTTAVACS